MKKLLLLLILLPAFSFGFLGFGEDKLTQEDEELIAAANTNEKKFKLFYKVFNTVMGIDKEDYRQSIINFGIHNTEFCGLTKPIIKQGLIGLGKIEEGENDELVIFYTVVTAFGIGYEPNSGEEYTSKENFLKCAFGVKYTKKIMEWRKKHKGNIQTSLYELEEKSKNSI